MLVEGDDGEVSAEDEVVIRKETEGAHRDVQWQILGVIDSCVRIIDCERKRDVFECLVEVDMPQVYFYFCIVKVRKTDKEWLRVGKEIVSVETGRIEGLKGQADH